MLMHCLAKRQIHLQQFCRSLAAIRSSAAQINNTLLIHRLNKNEAGVSFDTATETLHTDLLKVGGMLRRWSALKLCFLVATVDSFSTVKTKLISHYDNLSSCS